MGVILKCFVAYERSIKVLFTLQTHTHMWLRFKSYNNNNHFIWCRPWAKENVQLITACFWCHSIIHMFVYIYCFYFYSYNNNNNNIFVAIVTCTILCFVQSVCVFVCYFYNKMFRKELNRKITVFSNLVTFSILIFSH